jgi:hypothetical protein
MLFISTCKKLSLTTEIRRGIVDCEVLQAYLLRCLTKDDLVLL